MGKKSSKQPTTRSLTLLNVPLPPTGVPIGVCKDARGFVEVDETACLLGI